MSIFYYPFSIFNSTFTFSFPVPYFSFLIATLHSYQSKKYPQIQVQTFSIHHISTFSNYSERRLFTGFAIAAFIAWKLTVINVIINAPTPDATNTHTDIDVLYS